MRKLRNLIFVPGTMNDHRLWSRVLPLLPTSWQCRCVPLHTASTRDEMRQMLADYANADCHLIGFSMGAYLALEHALAHPVGTLTFIAAAAQGLSQQEQTLRKDMLNWLQNHDYNGMARQRLRTLIHPDHEGDVLMLNLVRQMDRELGKSVLITQLRETSTRRNLLPDIAQLSCPVLLIGAHDDQLVDPAGLQAMHQALPQSELLMVQNCGHLIPLEQAGVLAQALIDFLAPRCH